MTSQTFISEQKMLNDELAQSLTKELLNFPMPSCSAIFLGTDESDGSNRAHIYTVDNGFLTCNDEAGFSTIGIGMSQAMSSLMFSGFALDISASTALYITFASKKLAEVVPGLK